MDSHSNESSRVNAPDLDQGRFVSPIGLRLKVTRRIRDGFANECIPDTIYLIRGE